MKKSLFKKIILATMMLFIVSLGACTKTEEPFRLGEGDWDSNAFHDQVAKFIIENGYDKEVEILTADTAILIPGLKSGNVDASLEVWSDNITSYSDDIASGNYIELSTNFDDNAQGLYIPKYLQEQYPDLKTVKDLKDYAHLFPNPEGGDKGIIYGGPESWSATAFLDLKMATYGLNDLYTFKTIDSSATLFATLSSAYEKKEPWVGYGWEPTWIMGMLDMVLLEDESYSVDNFNDGIGSFPSVNVTVCMSNDASEKYPEIKAFLANYHTSSALTNEALAYMSENNVEADQAALYFLKNNTDLWSSWVTKEAYDKVMTALDQFE